MKNSLALLLILLSFQPFDASAQMMRSPAFIGGIPGRSISSAIFTQRHQARTLLYREALEELRKNPQAADLPVCATGVSGTCLATQKTTEAPATTSVQKEKSEAVATTASTEIPSDPEIAPAKPEPAPVKPEPVPVKPEPAPVKGRRIALLIGNDDYNKPIPPLETPIKDVSEIAKLLDRRFGFTSSVIKNASQDTTIKALNKLAGEVTPEDSVLLFYAGHGYLMEDIKMGFWIPVGASVKTAKGWISNADISKMLSAIRARQLILISDSCFSGSLTNEQKITETSEVRTDELLRRRSVLVLSSGGDEPVSDEGKDGHSIFAWNLLRTLKEMGAVTPGVRVWSTLHTEVKKEYPQTPQYGAVLSAGHDQGGDYVFLPN